MALKQCNQTKAIGPGSPPRPGAPWGGGGAATSAVKCDRLRRWNFRRRCGSAVHRLLHHQIQRHGYGALNLPFDHGGPWWPPLGHGKCTPRCHVSIRPAPASRRCVRIGHPKSSPEPASAKEPIVFVIDDDASMRRALTNLFQSVGLTIEVFGSAPEMLKSKLPDVASCLVLDIRLPGLSGLDFQNELAKANIHIPIIFMTGHGDIPMTVRAMKSGAVDFLTKPFRDQDMLDAVVAAIERDRKRREAEKITANFQALFESLTPRERDVLVLVTSGLMNKQVAAELGLAEITVKIYRGHIMKKMGARSLADLIRMAEKLGIRSPKPSGGQI